MLPLRRSVLGLLLGAAILSRSPNAAAVEPPIPTLPVVVSIASEDGKPVRDDAWIEAQLAEADRLFTPIGLHLKKTAQRPLDERYAHLETRQDRDALAAQIVKGVINVMIVASLRDVDDPSLYRMGVHWALAAKPRTHYVIVSAEARGSTTAHEIGHFFGLPHAAKADNLMSYTRTGAPVFLDDLQARTMRSFARNYLRASDLAPVP
jgi:hypothetical protein